MDYQPTLQNEIATVRPLLEEDLEPLYMAASDPKIWKGMPAKGRHKRENFIEFFEYVLSTEKAFAILNTQTKEIIGTTRYYLVSRHRLCMGSTFIQRNYWGGEMNKAFRTLLIDNAFLHYNKIHIHITKDNLRNQRATEKLGFVYQYDEEMNLGRGKTRNYMTYVLEKK